MKQDFDTERILGIAKIAACILVLVFGVLYFDEIAPVFPWLFWPFILAVALGVGWLLSIFGRRLIARLCNFPPSFKALCASSLVGICIFGGGLVAGANLSHRYTLQIAMQGVMLVKHDRLTGRTWTTIPARNEPWREVKDPVQARSYTYEEATGSDRK